MMEESFPGLLLFETRTQNIWREMNVEEKSTWHMLQIGSETWPPSDQVSSVSFYCSAFYLLLLPSTFMQLLQMPSFHIPVVPQGSEKKEFESFKAYCYSLKSFQILQGQPNRYHSRIHFNFWNSDFPFLSIHKEDKAPVSHPLLLE